MDTIGHLERLLSDPSSGVGPPAAVIVEVLQGEGGLNSARMAWLLALQQLCHEIVLPSVDATQIEVGYGLAVTRNERRVLLGSQRYMNQSQVSIPQTIQQLALEREASGHSLVYLARDGVLQGVIELQPTVRPEAPAVVAALHGRGLQLAMITGDQVDSCC